jgi:hypothetical protein
MPLKQGAGILRVVIGTGRNLTVDATTHSSRTIRSSNEENGLLTLDHGFRGHGVTQQRLLLFKSSDEFLPILNLEGGIRHYCLLQITS